MSDPIPQKKQSLLPPSVRSSKPPTTTPAPGTTTTPSTGPATTPSVPSKKKSPTDSFSSIEDLIKNTKEQSTRHKGGTTTHKGAPAIKLGNGRSFRPTSINLLIERNIRAELPAEKLYSDVSLNLNKVDGLGDLNLSDDNTHRRSGDTGSYSFVPGGFVFYSGGIINTSDGKRINRPMSISYDRGATWKAVDKTPPYVEAINALNLVPTADGLAFRNPSTKKYEVNSGLYYLGPEGTLFYEGVKNKAGAQLQSPMTLVGTTWDLKKNTPPPTKYQFIGKYGLVKESDGTYSRPGDTANKYYLPDNGQLIVYAKDSKGKDVVYIETTTSGRKLHPQSDIIIKNKLTPKGSNEWKLSSRSGTAFIQHDGSILYQGKISGEDKLGIWMLPNLDKSLPMASKYEENPLKGTEDGYLKIHTNSGKAFLNKDGTIVYLWSDSKKLSIVDADGKWHSVPKKVFEYIYPKGADKEARLFPQSDGTWHNPEEPNATYNISTDGTLTFTDSSKDTYKFIDGDWKKQ